jgi:hypothetical protein
VRHVPPGIVLDGGLAGLARRRESSLAAAGYEPAVLAIASATASVPAASIGTGTAVLPQA